MWVLLGMVGVDCGELLIGDPCYYHGEDSEFTKAYKTWADYCENNPREEIYHSMVFNRGHAGLGVICSTAHGDGLYPVYGFVTVDSTVPKCMLVCTDITVAEGLGLPNPQDYAWNEAGRYYTPKEHHEG